MNEQPSLLINETELNFVAKKEMYFTEQAKCTPPPYILLMCNAFRYKNIILKECHSRNIDILEVRKYKGFIGYAKKIYNINNKIDYLWLAALYKEYGMESDDFEIWVFNNNLQVKIQKLKYDTRIMIGNWNRLVSYNNRQYTIEQHHIHCPELSEMNYEYNLLSNLLYDAL